MTAPATADKTPPVASLFLQDKQAAIIEKTVTPFDPTTTAGNMDTTNAIFI